MEAVGAAAEDLVAAGVGDSAAARRAADFRVAGGRPPTPVGVVVSLVAVLAREAVSLAVALARVAALRGEAPGSSPGHARVSASVSAPPSVPPVPDLELVLASCRREAGVQESDRGSRAANAQRHFPVWEAAVCKVAGKTGRRRAKPA